MVQITNIESIETNKQEQNPFHACRVRFNKSFLNEDFISAEAAIQEAAKLPELSPMETEELTRYFRMLGKGEMALQLIDRSITLAPQNLSLYLLKSDLLQNLDASEALEAHLKTSLQVFPANETLFQKYHQFLCDASRNEEAESLALEAAVNGIDLIPKLPEAPIPDPDSNAIELSEATLRDYLQLIGGRENAYARQWANDQGQSGYSLVNEPLTIPVLRNHLLGAYTLGTYQLDTSSQVKWIVYDLDMEKSHQADLLDPSFLSWADALMQEKLKEIGHLLSVYQIPFHIEYSGFKGYHIWIFLAEKTSASLAKSLAERLSAQIPMDGLPLHLEIFPKQGKIATGNYGNLVKIPYGIHRRSGKLSTMLNEDFQPISLSEFLASVSKLQPETFIAALDSLGYNAFAKPESPPDTPKNDTYQSILPDPETDLEWLCLKQNCHALAFLDHIIATKGLLSPPQKNVIKYTIGYLKNGPAIVNLLLKKCHNIDANDYMKSGFKGNATSCSKIRTNMGPDFDPSLCNCTFDTATASYPNPLLHLEKVSVNTAVDLNEMKIQDLVDRYLKIQRNHQEISRQLKRLEIEILHAFDTVGVSEFKTDYGILCKTESTEGALLTLKLPPHKD